MQHRKPLWSDFADSLLSSLPQNSPQDCFFAFGELANTVCGLPIRVRPLYFVILNIKKKACNTANLCGVTLRTRTADLLITKDFPEAVNYKIKNVKSLGNIRQFLNYKIIEEFAVSRLTLSDIFNSPLENLPMKTFPNDLTAHTVIQNIK